MTPVISERVVKVRILDHEYQIRSDDDAKVRQIAEYLNRQIEHISQHTPVLNRIDLSVMAAFKAATDFFQAREDLEELRRKVESQAAELARKIETGLSDPSPQGSRTQNNDPAEGHDI